MNKLKKIIIIILVFTAIIAILLSILLMLNLKNDNNNIITEGTIEKGHNEASTEATIITPLYNNVEYFRVKDCIDTYTSFSLDLLYNKVYSG